MKVTFAAEGVEVSKNFEVEVKVPPGGRRGVGRIRGVYWRHNKCVSVASVDSDSSSLSQEGANDDGDNSEKKTRKRKTFKFNKIKLIEDRINDEDL